MANLPTPLLLPKREFLVLTPRDDDRPDGVDFTIRMPPMALRRGVFVARIRRAVNPQYRLIMQFRSMTAQVLNGLHFHNKDTKVQLGIVFRKRRPNYHYIGNNSSRGIVRADKLHAMVTGGDIDNMGKL